MDPSPPLQVTHKSIQFLIRVLLATISKETPYFLKVQDTCLPVPER